MHVVLIRTRWFLPLLLLLASALVARSETASLSRTLFDETFQAKSGVWMSPTAQAGNGTLALACVSDGQYEGVQVVFTPALKAPPAGEGQLRLQFTVAGVTSPNGGYSARFFLVPESIGVEQWVEPYGMPHVLAVYIDGSPEAATLTLYAKSGTETGCGRPLYSGGFTAKSFPLTMTLLIDRDNYRVQFGGEVETKTGSRSGKHGLDEAKWSGNLTSGLRLVNLTKGNKPAIQLAGAKASIELAPLVAAAAGTPTAAHGPLTAVIQVHPQVAQSVGGYNQVQALFGGNVNGETRGKADDLVRELNLNRV